ncbi:hypothetical protein BSKO_08884 [Bryopsis sp. KO-2023]|nr:hypothetical protein BSKO_08884 [Bryopsis sp. KO-2023]
MASNGNSMSGETLQLFEEGVGIAMSRWTALSLAVENQWGGRNSKEKAEQIVEDVLYWFEITKSPCPLKLEEQLTAALDEDFHVVVEDGSSIQVAKDLVQLFEQLSFGNQSMLTQLRKMGQSGASMSKQVAVEGCESSSSEEESGSDMEMEESKSEEPSNLKSQPGPVVDDDGFTLVQRKR